MNDPTEKLVFIARPRRIKGAGSKEVHDVSIQKLVVLKRGVRRGLGCRPYPRIHASWSSSRADVRFDLRRLLHRLGVDDDCSIRISAAQALGRIATHHLNSEETALPSSTEFAQNQAATSISATVFANPEAAYGNLMSTPIESMLLRLCQIH